MEHTTIVAISYQCSCSSKSHPDKGYLREMNHLLAIMVWIASVFSMSPTVKSKGNCSRPRVLNGHVTGPTFLPVGSNVTITCEVDFLLEGVSVITCGQSGIWDYAIPRCLGKCPLFSVDRGAIYRVRPQREDTSSFYPGDVAKVICRRGYISSINYDHIYCQDGGNWTDQPHCMKLSRETNEPNMQRETNLWPIPMTVALTFIGALLLLALYRHQHIQKINDILERERELRIQLKKAVVNVSNMETALDEYEKFCQLHSGHVTLASDLVDAAKDQLRLWKVETPKAKPVSVVNVGTIKVNAPTSLESAASSKKSLITENVCSQVKAKEIELKTAIAVSDINVLSSLLAKYVGLCEWYEIPAKKNLVSETRRILKVVKDESRMKENISKAIENKDIQQLKLEINIYCNFAKENSVWVTEDKVLLQQANTLIRLNDHDRQENEKIRKQQLILELDMERAMSLRDQKEVASALSRYLEFTEAHNLARSTVEPPVSKVEHCLLMVQINDALQEGIRDKDLAVLTKALNRAQQNGITSDLEMIVSKAKTLCISLEKINVLKNELMYIEKEVFLELQTLSCPSEDVQDIIKATALVIGLSESETSDWSTCKNILNPFPAANYVGLYKSIRDFDVKSLCMDTVSVLKSILLRVNERKATIVNRAASVLLRWLEALCIIFLDEQLVSEIQHGTFEMADSVVQVNEMVVGKNLIGEAQKMLSPKDKLKAENESNERGCEVNSSTAEGRQDAETLKENYQRDTSENMQERGNEDIDDRYMKKKYDSLVKRLTTAIESSEVAEITKWLKKYEKFCMRNKISVNEALINSASEKIVHIQATIPAKVSGLSSEEMKHLKRKETSLMSKLRNAITKNDWDATRLALSKYEELVEASKGDLILDQSLVDESKKKLLKERDHVVDGHKYASKEIDGKSGDRSVQPQIIVVEAKVKEEPAQQSKVSDLKEHKQVKIDEAHESVKLELRQSIDKQDRDGIKRKLKKYLKFGGDYTVHLDEHLVREAKKVLKQL